MALVACTDRAEGCIVFSWWDEQDQRFLCQIILGLSTGTENIMRDELDPCTLGILKKYLALAFNTCLTKILEI